MRHSNIADDCQNYSRNVYPARRFVVLLLLIRILRFICCIFATILLQLGHIHSIILSSLTIGDLRNCCFVVFIEKGPESDSPSVQVLRDSEAHRTSLDKNTANFSIM